MDGASADQSVRCPHCGNQTAVPLTVVGPGQEIGGYRIERRLGAGGMGEVWLAEQISMGRKVALKILPPILTQNPSVTERFVNEIKNTAKLDHPNIVAAYDAGYCRGIYYLAVSYVDGALLEDILKIDKAIPERKALGIARDIADALRYAWTKFKMLHRDIKPSNIMLDRDGVPKLMDMGIAKIIPDNPAVISTSTVVGTPFFMSPEQQRGEKNVDCRSDIYSLGATLFNLVTGTLPLSSKDNPDPFENAGIPAGSRNAAFKASPLLVALVRKMMAKSPEDRQRTWEEVIGDIDSVLSGKSPAGQGAAVAAGKAGAEAPPHALEAAAPSLFGDRRTRSLLLAAILVLLVAIVLFLFSVLRTIRMQDELRRKDLEKQILEKEIDFSGKDGKAP